MKKTATILKKYQYLGLTEEKVRLNPHWDDLTADTLEYIALQVKPSYIPRWVANILWKRAPHSYIMKWFNNSMITSISEKNNQLFYTRQSLVSNEDSVKKAMKSLIGKCFQVCSICGSELNPVKYGIVSKCDVCIDKGL